jgi:biopolymer transport protein ExbB
MLISHTQNVVVLLAEGILTNLFQKVALLGAEWVLWVLLALSFISIGIIVDRLLYFWRNSEESERLNSSLPEQLRAGDVRGAWDLVANSEGVGGAIVAAGLKAMRRGPDSCNEAMQSVKSRLRGELDARLSILGTIGANAPFIGLMGTVLGVIKAANDLTGGQQTGADPNAVMAGVFQALVATAVGLFVAIPAVIAFNFFNRKVRAAMSQIDSLAHLVLAYVHAADRRATTPEAPQAARVS